EPCGSNIRPCTRHSEHQSRNAESQPSAIRDHSAYTLLTAVEIQMMAAPLAVVVNAQALDRLPGRELKIVRHDTRAFLELLFENRGHQLIPHRQQVHGQKIGR